MLVVMEQGATEEQVEHVIERLTDLGFDVHRSTGVIHTVLGGVGGKYDFDLAVFEVMEGVKEAHRIVSPYKLASRGFRPAGALVQVGELAIGEGAGAAEARDRGHHRGTAAVGGVYTGGWQLQRDSLRARDTNVRDLHAQHHGYFGDSSGEDAFAPADDCRSIARDRAARQGRADGT